MVQEQYLPRPLYNFTQALHLYDGKQPLQLHLAAYGREHRLGSGDRRTLYRLVYAYFRLGDILQGEDPLKRLAVALFLFENAADRLSTDILTKYLSNYIELVNNKIVDKIKVLSKNEKSFQFYELFPLHEFLSPEIEKDLFIKSFFTQPRLWIRMRRGFEKNILAELTAKNVPFEANKTNPLSLSFVNGTNLQELDSFIKGHFEIQDISSQKVAQNFDPKKGEDWWDCCAGSGGKSLLLLDKEQDIRLTVSDIREGILENLRKRLQKAAYPKPRMLVADLLKTAKIQGLNASFDGIIADVPCSGSGTWGRNPEWLHYFKAEQIKQYSAKQFEIVRQAIQYLRPGGRFIYCTCSVFAEENEKVVERIQKECGLELLSSGYMKGFTQGADTLFAARFSKK